MSVMKLLPVEGDIESVRVDRVGTFFLLVPMPEPHCSTLGKRVSSCRFLAILSAFECPIRIKNERIAVILQPRPKDTVILCRGDGRWCHRCFGSGARSGRRVPAPLCLCRGALNPAALVVGCPFSGRCVQVSLCLCRGGLNPALLLSGGVCFCHRHFGFYFNNFCGHRCVSFPFGGGYLFTADFACFFGFYCRVGGINRCLVTSGFTERYSAEVRR